MAAVKGPIVADDLYQVTGRGHIFTAAPHNVSEVINVGDLVRFTTTNPKVIADEFFSVDSTYKVIGIEVVRTMMYPPQIKGYGFVVSKTANDDPSNLVPSCRRCNWVRDRMKLTDVQVGEIRAAYARGGVTQRRLADQYGISPSMVSRLVTGSRRR